MATSTGQYQLNSMTEHSTVLLRDSLYCLGESQEDNEEKRTITSSLKLDVLHLQTFKWGRMSTTGNPPVGVMSYACTNIENNILYYGGCCKVDDSYHNNLCELNTITNNWTDIISTSPDNVPMRKQGCKMISFNTNGEYSLFLSGGVGPTPVTSQLNSQYIPSPNKPNLSFTNEMHIMHLTSSPGQWNAPVITGTRPPPCAHFTMNTLPGNRGVMFGGVTINEGNHFHCVNDLYLFQYSDNTIDFQNIVKPSGASVKWPNRRDSHASSIINTTSSDQQVTSHLIIIGGWDNNLQAVSDCWIINLSTLIWHEINLPESVTNRFAHSITTYQISKDSFQVIVIGGIREYSLVSGCDMTVIVELGYINDEWTVGDIWNSHNIPKAKQKNGFLSNMFGDPGRKLQVENQILSRQLEESKQEIILTKRKADTDLQEAQNSMEEVEKSIQVVIESCKQEIQEYNTRLQQTHSQLQESDTRLQETQSQLQESDTRLQETQSKLNKSDTRLQETQSQLQQANTRAQEMQQQIQELSHHVEELNQQNQRKEDLVQRQQEEILGLHIQLKNPHWVIERDEVQMTEEILGTGGWGEVKVGIFRGTKIAVKRLHQMILSPHNLDLFSREMHIASRVCHPNLLQFIGATKVGNPMILTELMPTSLRKELEKTPLTHRQISTVSSGVASALNYLHLWKPQPILHRDVSSANVLLEPSGNGRWKGKLSDYGSANLLHKTHTVAPGSIAYAAPEAQSPHLHSPAMDVFSFGILIAEMVIRRFPSGVPLEREQQIQSVQWPSIKQLVVRCTINNPQHRPTIEQVLQDINKM